VSLAISGLLRLQKAVALDDLPRSLVERHAGRAGERIFADREIATLCAPVGALGRTVAPCLPRNARAVRAIFFNKSVDSNWTLAWHQDRTIAVKRRIDTPGFGPWTKKAGMVHVEPPFGLLERMITVRLHLDPVDDENGPLRVIPGSHQLGRIEERAYDAIVANQPERICRADAGDVWVYSTPILHASASAIVPRNRRVLQVDYSADDLPNGLEWLGV
jgi:Phytanoyl-CoA dioxygenase (PhyH)